VEAADSLLRLGCVVTRSRAPFFVELDGSTRTGVPIATLGIGLHAAFPRVAGVAIGILKILAPDPGFRLPSRLSRHRVPPDPSVERRSQGQQGMCHAANPQRTTRIRFQSRLKAVRSAAYFFPASDDRNAQLSDGAAEKTGSRAARRYRREAHRGRGGRVCSDGLRAIAVAAGRDDPVGVPGPGTCLEGGRGGRLPRLLPRPAPPPVPPSKVGECRGPENGPRTPSMLSRARGAGYAIQTDLILTNSRMPYSESSRP
jgi:hypothetical protein